MCKFHIDPVLYTGRPADEGGRSPVEIRCYDLLDGERIPFWRADHAPARSVADCEAVERVLGVGVSKNLFLRDRKATRFYLLLMPARKPFRTRELTVQLGTAHLSFAEETHLETLLGLRPGAVSILGLAHDRAGQVTLLIDRAIVSGAFIRCHPCVNTSTLKIRTGDVLERLLPALGHAPILVDLPEKEPIPSPESQCPQGSP